MPAAVPTMRCRWHTVRTCDASVHRLTRLHDECIRMHMRTTLNLDEALLKRASRLTGIAEKTALLRAGLQALVARASAQRLAALGGTEKSLHSIPRRRSRKRV